MSSLINKVAAYIRVSTEEQAEQGDSLDEQRERLTAYCKAMGWAEPVIFAEEGRSAKNLKRPALQKLIKAVEAGKFDAVITTKLDRLCRNLRDLLEIVDRLEQYDCSYVSASEHFDTSTSVGRMTLQLLGTFAEFERSRISDNVRATMSSIARNTDRAITRECYGYEVVDGEFRIVEEEAEHLRFMFDMILDNNGSKKIVQALNARGSRTKSGRLWCQTNFFRIAKNEKLKGWKVYNKSIVKGDKQVSLPPDQWTIKENSHQAIIPPEVFDKAQEKLSSRARGRYVDNHSYILTGVLKCGHCGGNMRGRTVKYKNKEYSTYECSTYTSGKGCKYHSAKRIDVETFVLDFVERVASEFTTDYIKTIVKQQPKQNDESEDLRAQLKRIDTRIQKVIAGWTDGFITDEDMKLATSRAETERQEINELLKNIENTEVDVTEIRERAEGFAGLERLEQKQAVKDLFAEIIYTQGRIDFEISA